MDLYLRPIKELGLKVSQYIKKIHWQFPMLMIKSSDQTQFMGNGVLPQSIQNVGHRMRQTFQNRSLSEGNVPPNMPRNNNEDDNELDEGNDPNRPPPLSTSSSEPIFKTYEGNVVKHDNSQRITNILSYNTKGNVIENSFNHNHSSPQSLCLFFRFWRS